MGILDTVGDCVGFGLVVGAEDEDGLILGEDPQSEAQKGPF